MPNTNPIPILEIAILEMGRLKKGETFDPLEVIQWMFPQHWKFFIEELNSEVERLYKERKVWHEQPDLLTLPIELQSRPIKIKIWC